MRVKSHIPGFNKLTHEIGANGSEFNRWNSLLMMVVKSYHENRKQTSQLDAADGKNPNQGKVMIITL